MIINTNESNMYYLRETKNNPAIILKAKNKAQFDRWLFNNLTKQEAIVLSNEFVELNPFNAAHASLFITVYCAKNYHTYPYDNEDI